MRFGQIWSLLRTIRQTCQCKELLCCLGVMVSANLMHASANIMKDCFGFRGFSKHSAVHDNKLQRQNLRYNF